MPHRQYSPAKRMRFFVLEQGRATEWCTAASLLAIGLTLAAPGETLNSPSFSGFAEFWVDDAALAGPLCLIGAIRFSALYVNGNWRRTPIMRMLGAVAGMTFFALLSLVLAWPSIHLGAPISTGVGVYFVLALFDGLAAYRSGADMRLANDMARGDVRTS